MWRVVRTPFKLVLYNYLFSTVRESIRAGRCPGEGYSDLDWTGVCHSSLKVHSHSEGSFWQKKVPIFSDFSQNIDPFFKILEK